MSTSTDDESDDDSTATVDERGDRARASSDTHTTELDDLPPRFEAKRILGKGGMGVVVEVMDRSLGRTVAVKLLAADKRDPVHRVRFRREAKAAAVLRHPNIVTVYDVDTERDFIVMELVRGESLRSWVKRDGSLAAADVRRVALALLDALAAAHDAKIIHRDIKPANILIDEHGIVKLVDFGIASFGDRDLTSTGMRVGTPAYMAPEQLRGRVADVRADLYAVGATLFEVATGRQLHAEGRTPEVAGAEVAAATGDVGLAGAIQRAVAELPEERFQSAREFAAALRDSNDELSARSSPHIATATLETAPGGPAAAAAPRRRARWLYALAGVAVVALASIPIAMLARGGQSPPRGTDSNAAYHKIAVLPFTDHTGETQLDFSSAGLPNILAAELKAIPELEIVGYYDLVDRVSDPTAPLPEWREMAKQVGADLVVDGELMTDLGGVRVVITLETIAGATMGRYERVTTIDKVPTMTRTIAADIARDAIGRATPGIVDTRQFEVDSGLQRAIQAIERQDLPLADEYLSKVELVAPDLAEAQYYRALLNWWLSRDIKEPVARALAGNLDPAQRGFMEGLRLVWEQDHLTPAIDKFRDLIEKFPNHRDIQYGLFEALYHGGHPIEAMVAYRRLVDQHPRYRLGMKHALAYYIGHGDEDGMTWAISRLDPQLDESVAWQARSLVARRDYQGAIALLRRHDPRGANRDLQRDLAGIYFLVGDLALAADTSARWPSEDIAHRAVDLFGMQLALGRTDDAATWSTKATSAADLVTGEEARDHGWLELAQVQLSDPDPARLAPVAKGLASMHGINAAIARTLVAGALDDRAAIEAARTSEFPEVVAIADAYHAEWEHDARAAAAGWRRATANAADGMYTITEQLGLARAARTIGDHMTVLGACDEVIRPRRFSWAWGGAVGPCLRWTAEAATALGHADQAKAAWTRLIELRAKATAGDELLAAARAALGR